MLRLRRSSASLHSGSTQHDTILAGQKTGRTVFQNRSEFQSSEVNVSIWNIEALNLRRRKVSLRIPSVDRSDVIWQGQNKPATAGRHRA